MFYPKNIREEELKIRVGQDWFHSKIFDCSRKIGNIDFAVLFKNKNLRQLQLFENQSIIWAEAKVGNFDLYSMFSQLILTIGKERSFDKHLPPVFLCVFDCSKIAFVPYNKVMDVFSLNDFNWNVRPSNHQTKEFKIIKDRIEVSLEQDSYVYNFLKDEAELRFFIKNNVAKSTEKGKITIDKNNFVPIYLRWLDTVKPNISFDWEEGKKVGILDSSFYLADLFVDDKNTPSIEDDISVKENLFVVFRNEHYEIAKENLKSLFNASIEINDKTSYENFWKRYKRPPIEEFQKYILERKDLLVPQDIRERKGAFFTPKIWVELSQNYIANVLGEDWQDEYYVWDCAAGTGNLLNGLKNKYNIWASTLDQSDVNVMHDRIENGAILLKDHVFQFDFLNDSFTKLPQGLQDIINDSEKRKKLVIYINPPYAESGSTKLRDSKVGVSNETMTHKRLFSKISTFSKRELYVQFLWRIYSEIPTCTIANFSKLKNLQSSYFSEFRDVFRAKLEKIFLVPADTFDNVKGKFPIGFFIWNTQKSEKFLGISADVFDRDGEPRPSKTIFNYDDVQYINDWLRPTWKNPGEVLGYLACNSNDFQNQNGVYIALTKRNATSTYFKPISLNNIIHSVIYYAVRHCIPATWLNDRDQFLFPNDAWKTDLEFQSDCLTFTLFSNNLQSKSGINHWIPFTEHEVNAREKFESNFMTQFIRRKLKSTFVQQDLFSEIPDLNTTAFQFSDKAELLFEAGRNLWSYYHLQPHQNVNASLYDIREYFQGRDENGKMKNTSSDEKYIHLIKNLRWCLKILAKKIEPKVYEYGFLKE